MVRLQEEWFTSVIVKQKNGNEEQYFKICTTVLTNLCWLDITKFTKSQRIAFIDSLKNLVVSSKVVSTSATEQRASPEERFRINDMSSKTTGQY